MFNKASLTLKKIFAFSLCASLMISCLSDPKKSELDYKTYEVEGHPTVQANIVFVEGEGNEIDKINEIIIDSTLASVFPDAPLESVPEALDAFVKNYESFKADFPESEQVWELSVETEVVFQSATVVTYSINTYTFTGGAHGNDRIILLNFDPATGNYIPNEELIANKNAFKTVAEKAFLKSMKEANPDSNMEDYFFGEAFKLPENMGYSEDGFIMLYNVYEIASYAQGYTEFAIPYEDLNGTLKISPY